MLFNARARRLRFYPQGRGANRKGLAAAKRVTKYINHINIYRHYVRVSTISQADAMSSAVHVLSII